MSYVFNGDFVDRGAHSLEVIGLLLALKVSMPNRIWLVRGNHEDRTHGPTSAQAQRRRNVSNGSVVFDETDETTGVRGDPHSSPF